MTKGREDNSPKQNRPEQDRSWRDINSQDDQLNNSNRHNNNPPYDGSPETRSNPSAQGSQNQKSQTNQNTDTGAGVSGRPNNQSNHSTLDGQNAPNYQDGPVAGGADNTRGENVPSREGHAGGAKHGKFDPEQHSPQGSNANWSDTRGSDSSDKEFKNNQPNASTLKGHKSNENLGNEKE